MTKMKLPELTEQELKYLADIENRQIKAPRTKYTEAELENEKLLAESQIGKKTIDEKGYRKRKPPCDCGDPENCRVCCMIEAHKHRIAGDIPEFERWLAKATGMWGKEVIKKHGGRSGFIE